MQQQQAIPIALNYLIYRIYNTFGENRIFLVLLFERSHMDHFLDINTVEKKILAGAASMQRPANGALELLPLCNMNCDMCYIHLSRNEMEKKGRLHTAEEWSRLGEEMARAGVLFVLLTGGEPLLFPNFRKLYLDLRRRGMILTVNTNGTLLDEEWAEFFGKYKPRRMNITLYGADQKAYENLCHYPEGYEKTCRGIRLLKEKGVDVKINGSVTKDNRQDMQAIYRLGKEWDIPVHMDTYMLPGIHEADKPLEAQARLSPEDAAAAEMEVLRSEMDPEEFLHYVQRKNVQIESGYTKHPAGISCMAGNCSFTVNWQGNMHPCVSLDYPSVNVFEVGFENAWEKISTESKKIHIHNKCIQCHLRSVCKTCVSSARLETGQYDGLPEYLCRYTNEYARLLQLCKNSLP